MCGNISETVQERVVVTSDGRGKLKMTEVKM